MPTSHLFEITLDSDGSELLSSKVSKLSRRYSRLSQKINTMSAPPDVARCSVLLVNKNSTHPAAVAARRDGGRPPPKARVAVPPRESPARGAKDKANERLAAQLAQRAAVSQLAQRAAVPVAQVVQSPMTSPDGPLVPPPAAASTLGEAMGIDGGGGDSDDEDDPPSPPPRGPGRKTTGLVFEDGSPLFSPGSSPGFADR